MQKQRRLWGKESTCSLAEVAERSHEVECSHDTEIVQLSQDIFQQLAERCLRFVRQRQPREDVAPLVLAVIDELGEERPEAWATSKREQQRAACSGCEMSESRVQRGNW